MTKRSLAIAAFALAFAAGCGAGDVGSSSPNSMLERWCDKHPCDWDVAGRIEQVGTWHPNDYAVALLGDDAEISQLRAGLDATRARCLSFSLMAEIDVDTEVYLELDFLDDGKLELSERIPTSHWEVRTFTISTPTWYDGVRFIVRKASQGRAVLGGLNVELAMSGCAASPLPLLERPTGASCDRDDECSSGGCRLMETSARRLCD